MQKQILFVIFGGESNEYEVSLKSSSCVLENIDEEKYIIYKIGITKSGEWYYFNGDVLEIYNDTWYKNSKNIPISVDLNEKMFVLGNEKIRPDIVFPIMHGEFGEDGRIQGLCELMHIPVATSSSFSSFLCMDKYLCKMIASSVGIPVADYLILYENSRESVDKAWKKSNKWKKGAFVKPTRAGSSVGVSFVKTKKDMELALENAFKISNTVLVEKAIDGCETEIALLEDGREIIATSAGKLSYKSKFYDYETKYHSDSVEYEIPAKIPDECAILCQNYAKKLFLVFGCSSFCRMDFFVCKNGDVIFNEVNSIPGFTKSSMYPMLFEYEGYKIKDLINKILENAK